MVIRRLKQQSSSGNALVQIKRTENGSFGTYEEIVSNDGTVTYTTYDDLDYICSAYMESTTTKDGTFKSRIDIAKVSAKLADNIAVSSHLVAVRTSPNIPFSTKTIAIFWKKNNDDWNKTSSFTIQPHQAAILSEVIGYDFSEAKQAIGDSIETYLKASNLL